jgi:hypothetical protein
MFFKERISKEKIVLSSKESNVNIKDNNAGVRVLAREMAQELSMEELAQVGGAGGTGTASGTWSSTTKLDAGADGDYNF